MECICEHGKAEVPDVDDEIPDDACRTCAYCVTQWLEQMAGEQI